MSKSRPSIYLNYLLVESAIHTRARSLSEQARAQNPPRTKDLLISILKEKNLYYTYLYIINRNLAYEVNVPYIYSRS